MKKTVSVLIAIILMLVFCVGLTACSDTSSSNGNNNPGTNNPSDDNPTCEPFNVDLAGYVANIGTAKALGISKEVSSGVSPLSTRNTNSDIQLLSYTSLASNKDTEEKNYIVMSTVDYDANNPEADKTGLTKVTFTKIVTENVTTETIGTKYIIANEGSISISATSGFTYTVYYNDSLIYNEVKDNDDNDKEPKKGVIVLDNLTDGIEYKVNYKGIGVETTITQDDIEAEIDKLYVLNGYTFISFVPNGTSQRPHDSALVLDTDGIAHYDKCNYFSNSARQSFIIDNTTGYVYQINNFNIKEIQGGCLLSAEDNFIYDFKINANDEIEIFSLFQNNTIEWYSCFKDKYGNIFIRNNRLNTYDNATNTYFYVFNDNSLNSQYDKGINYELTSTNEAIKLSFWNMNNGANHIIGASMVLANGKERKLCQEDNFDIYYDVSKYEHVAYKVENGTIYGYRPTFGYSSIFILFKYDAVNNIATHYLFWADNWFNADYLEEYNILIEFYNGCVYYYDDVWTSYDSSSKQWMTSGGLINDRAFTPKTVLKDCNLEDNKILVYGISGNTYYDIVVESVNGQIVINQYISGTYQNPRIKITLQPINKG